MGSNREGPAQAERPADNESEQQSARVSRGFSRLYARLPRIQPPRTALMWVWFSGAEWMQESRFGDAEAVFGWEDD